MDIPDHAYHAPERRGRSAKLDQLAQRVLSREILLHELAVENDHLFAGVIVVRVEIPATHQWDLHRLEISGTYRLPIGLAAGNVRRQRLGLNLQSGVPH